MDAGLRILGVQGATSSLGHCPSLPAQLPHGSPALDTGKTMVAREAGVSTPALFHTTGIRQNSCQSTPVTLSHVILRRKALNTPHTLKKQSGAGRGCGIEGKREECLKEEQQQIDIHPFSIEVLSTLFTSGAEAQEPERYHTSSGWD